MNVIGWKVWYADGSVHTSAQSRWDDIPDDGVQAVRVYYDEQFAKGRPYSKILTGKDWYYMEDGDIFGIPAVGWDVFVAAPAVLNMYKKRGTAIDDASYQRIMKEVKEAVT